MQYLHRRSHPRGSGGLHYYIITSLHILALLSPATSLWTTAEHQNRQGINSDARLTKRVWNNSMLTTNTKMKVYQDSVLALFFTAVSVTMYTWQERRLIFPSALPEEDPGHHLGTVSQTLSAGPGKNIQHARTPFPRSPMLARPCLPNAGWPDS